LRIIGHVMSSAPWVYRKQHLTRVHRSISRNIGQPRTVRG